MGRKKKTNKEPHFTETEEFKLYEKLTNEMFDTKRKVSSSVVSSTIDNLTTDSIIVAVHQSIREPSITVDDELLNIPSELSDGITSIPYPINPNGIREIKNAAQNARNQWSNNCIGKLTPGNSSKGDLDAANKIGLALSVGGYLVTKSAVPYGLYRWKIWENTFYEKIDLYIAEYEEHYNKTMEAIKILFSGNLLEAWFHRSEKDKGSPFYRWIKRQSFNDKEMADEFVEELREQCGERNEVEGDEIDDYFAYAISTKTISTDSEKQKVFVVYWLDFKKRHVDNYVEILKANIENFMDRAKSKVPHPDNVEGIRNRFDLKFTFDRVPTTQEIERAREQRIEREWAQGVKKFAQEAGIKSRVETMFEIQEQLRSQMSENWGSLILENLRDALKDALGKVKTGSQDVVKYTSVQNLLGKGGLHPKAGLLDELLDIASDLKFGDGKLRDLLEELKKTANKNDPKIVSKELELTIKDISKEISASFGEDIPDQTIDVFETELDLSIIEETPEEDEDEESEDDDEVIDL